MRVSGQLVDDTGRTATENTSMRASSAARGELHLLEELVEVGELLLMSGDDLAGKCGEADLAPPCTDVRVEKLRVLHRVERRRSRGERGEGDAALDH